MSNKKYPDLSRAEFEDIIRSVLGNPKRTRGDHRIYSGIVNGKYAIAQVDHGRDPVFGRVISETIAHMNLTREEFYACNKSAARKIGVDYRPWKND